MSASFVSVSKEKIMNQALVGKIIAHCLIKAPLAEGGGGLVLLASHPKYGEEVVLKILPIEANPNPQTKLRFEREIQMSVELTHENIVQIYEARADKDNYYIIMEYIEGMDIDEWIDLKKKIRYQEALPIMVQISRALDFAHSKRIIHRDIKPSNILIDKAYRAKLCDFGLAKDLKMASDLTCTGMVLGTPDFMSPEQWFGAKDLTEQTDIYSLGATLYYMLTGHKPYEGESNSSVLSNSLFSELASPKKFVSDLPDSLCEIVKKMMAKDLEQRYKRSLDVTSDLENFLKNSGKGFFSRIFGGG